MSQNETPALSPKDLRKLQMVLLDMLSEVDRVCKKHDINYTLIGGTLLGAVRHGGFIPWDDDIDIAMLRSEFEKFKFVCQAEVDSDRYFFQDNSTDPEYRWGYARLRRLDSEFVRIGQEHMKMRTGIFLDIYPADNIPDFYPLRLLHAAYCFAIRKILYAQTGVVTGKTALVRTIYRLLDLIPSMIAFRRLDRLAKYKSGQQTKYVRALTFPAPKGGKLGFPAHWLAETVNLSFEDRRFQAMCAHGEYLKLKYGDYLLMPPEGKRHVHPAAVMRLPPDE